MRPHFRRVCHERSVKGSNFLNNVVRPLYLLVKNLRICDYRIGTPKNQSICGLRTNHKNCRFAICGLAHLRHLRNSGFAICGPDKIIVRKLSSYDNDLSNINDYCENCLQLNVTRMMSFSMKFSAPQMARDPEPLNRNTYISKNSMGILHFLRISANLKRQRH